MTGKGHTFLIYKEFRQIDRKKDNLIEKWAKYMNRYFTEETKIANEHLKQYASSLFIRQMQIKTINYCFFTYQISKFLRIPVSAYGRKNTFLYFWYNIWGG